MLRAVLLACLALIAYAQAGYGVLLALLRRVLAVEPVRRAPVEPHVSLVVAAHEEAAVVEARSLEHRAPLPSAGQRLIELRAKPFTRDHSRHAGVPGMAPGAM